MRLHQTSLLCLSQLSQTLLLRLLEKHLDGSSNYELAQADSLTMTAGTYTHPDRGTPFDEHSKEYRDEVQEEPKNRNGSTRGER